MSRLWEFPVNGARLATGGGLARVLLAAANLTMVVRFLKRDRRTSAALTLHEALWFVSAALVFGMLAHACDVMAVDRPGRAVSAAASVLTAVLLPAALSRAGWVPRRADGPARDDTLARAEADARRTLGERYEQIKVRVVMLEDRFNRSSWIRQSDLAMQQLTEMLSACESIPMPGERPCPAETAKIMFSKGTNSDLTVKTTEMST